MEIREIKYEHCGYKTRIINGIQDAHQTYSDLNEDFVNYQINLYPAGKEIHSIDANDKEFFGKCSIHNVKMKPLKKVPTNCLKYDGELHSKIIEFMTSKAK